MDKASGVLDSVDLDTRSGEGGSCWPQNDRTKAQNHSGGGEVTQKGPGHLNPL